MDEDLTELRGAGWKRLLTAARRNLERTGGALDHSIGLNSPTQQGELELFPRQDWSCGRI